MVDHPVTNQPFIKYINRNENIKDQVRHSEEGDALVKSIATYQPHSECPIQASPIFSI